ncbi:hypothetical protein Aave_1747 [Paracidovorax citrulli AAC00-1]|uniref:Uncharacterized protein n=1 Tax=Paracidovorax citrulli (strain AAC00-1) TaxID=397945 RepID=A1TMZ6_PARC0|nr:hypothetical protein Aave_1747 [Paracidovorax citrulli AAC00-1]
MVGASGRGRHQLPRRRGRRALPGGDASVASVCPVLLQQPAHIGHRPQEGGHGAVAAGTDEHETLPGRVAVGQHEIVRHARLRGAGAPGGAGL